MDMTVPELVLLGMCGAAFGSFVNVLAYRLPRRESVVKPRSRCPGCGTTIRAHDNIPIVSWILLRGRCRDCGMRISVRYPLVEAVTAALFVVVGIKFGREAALWPALALTVILVAAAATDLEERIILPLINEAVACLHDRVVDDAELLDAGLIFGTGFAPFRGGPIQYVRDTGADALVAKLESLAAKHGARFKPRPGWDDPALRGT